LILQEFTEDFLTRAAEWCRGRNWQGRLPFLIWFGYCLVKYWSVPGYSSVLSGLNLGIHELGHLVLSVFGTFVSVLGGTLFQLSAPLVSAINFYRQNDFFSITLCFCWLSVSIFEVAVYMADARQMNLPLVSPFGGGEDIIHDWNYILSKGHLLHYDTTLAFLLRCGASLLMLGSLAAGFWLLWQMKNNKVMGE
jgi:hypothetical protein